MYPDVGALILAWLDVMVGTIPVVLAVIGIVLVVRMVLRAERMLVREEPYGRLPWDDDDAYS